MPCTFIKALSFIISSEAIIDSSLIVNYTVTQDDLIIMEEESYHTILTIHKDKGPRTVTAEAVIEVEEVELVPKDPTHIPL